MTVKNLVGAPLVLFPHLTHSVHKFQGGQHSGKEGIPPQPKWSPIKICSVQIFRKLSDLRLILVAIWHLTERKKFDHVLLFLKYLKKSDLVCRTVFTS